MDEDTERVVVVTGGSRGMGYVTAETLGRTGATVVVVSNDEERLADAVGRLQSEGIRASGWACDLGDRAARTATIERLRNEFPVIQALVNNAGIAELHRLEETVDDVWDATLEVNLTAAFALIRGLAGCLSASGRGSVVNVGSVMGTLATVGILPYCASKAGLQHLTRALALELATKNVRVNAITPGFIRTDMFETVNTPAAQRAIIDAHPMGRIGAMTEVANVVKFLCSEDASFVTGVVLPVDGALTCRVAVPDLLALSEAA
ncbi:MAG TPA: SDR family NAD(P)-dependent oxidoreductase [Solirubrobacteraceae bacterium]